MGRARRGKSPERCSPLLGCAAEREPIPIHLCMQQVKILRRRVPLSLPDAGYFKPGEWETLATEAQSLCLLPGDSGGDRAGVRGAAPGGRSETPQRGPHLPSLGEGSAVTQPGCGEEWPCPAETKT